MRLASIDGMQIKTSLDPLPGFLVQAKRREDRASRASELVLAPNALGLEIYTVDRFTKTLWMIQAVDGLDLTWVSTVSLGADQ